MARNGFAASLTPQEKVKNIVKNTRRLHPDNIGAYVARQREVWADDYGRRCLDVPFTRDALFRTDEMDKFDEKSLVMNKDHSVSRIHYMNMSGPWALILQTHKNGNKDWSINVWAGNNFCFHPTEASNIIHSQADEATYKEWKRFVMARYEDDVTALLKDASRVMGRWNAWSVTCDDSSTRLMKRTPGIVTINPGVAFLFL